MPATPTVDNPFPALEPREALYHINIAIAKAEASQRYTIGDRELWRGDLRWMYPERARLEKQVAALARRGRPRFSRAVPL
jgi:hypothetical protein